MKYLHLGLFRVQVRAYVPVITSHIIIKTTNVKFFKISEFLKLTPIQDPHKWQLFQRGNDMIYGREKGRFPRHLRPVHRSKVIELLSDSPSSRYFLQSVFRSSSGLQLVPENLQSLGPILSLVLLSLILPPHE